MENRLIKKRLYEIALKEFKDKRPTEIIGYRVKKAVILHRGYGPSIILSGLKGKVVPFLLLANYGEQFRLYYLLENGVIINAINIPKEDFERESLKFQKATSKLFQIPKPQMPEKQVEKLKKLFNEKFQKYIALIEKETSCKIKNIPIITLYQPSVGSKATIKRERDFIRYPVDLVGHKLLDGFLAREAYRLVLPSFIRKTSYTKLFGVAGAYFQLPKSMSPDWIRYWEPTLSLKTIVTPIKYTLFHEFLTFLCYLGRFESGKFSDSQIKKIFSDFPEHVKKGRSNPEIAAHCYLNMANHEGFYNIKAALFFILANQFKQARKVLKELSKFSQTNDVQTIRIQSEYLASFQLAKIFSNETNLKSISVDTHALFQVALEHIKNQIAEITRSHDSKGSISEPITIRLKIKNHSDLSLKNLNLSDNLPKKSKIEFIGANSVFLNQLPPKKEITFEYQIISEIPQKMSFKTGKLVFEDAFSNHYAQSIPPTQIIIK